MDDTIQFFLGATLTLNYGFRDPSNSALAYPLGANAVATVINSTMSFNPTVVITDRNASNVQVSLQSGQTAGMTRRQRYTFQLKLDMGDTGPAGTPTNTVIILPMTEVMPL